MTALELWTPRGHDFVVLEGTRCTVGHSAQADLVISDDPAAHEGIRHKGRQRLDAIGAYLEDELTGKEWCLGADYSVADIYLYMLVGWQSYVEGGYVLGGDAVAAHYACVGARPAIAWTRELEDLDERLQRHHPELRGGRPI